MEIFPVLDNFLLHIAWLHRCCKKIYFPMNAVFLEEIESNIKKSEGTACSLLDLTTKERIKARTESEIKHHQKLMEVLKKATAIGICFGWNHRRQLDI
jgi:hypothetical protein